jgi:hypothetical protein
VLVGSVTALFIAAPEFVIFKPKNVNVSKSVLNVLAVGKAYLCCYDCECVAEAIESESGTCSSQHQQQQRRQRKALSKNDETKMANSSIPQ